MNSSCEIDSKVCTNGIDHPVSERSPLSPSDASSPTSTQSSSTTTIPTAKPTSLNNHNGISENSSGSINVQSAQQQQQQQPANNINNNKTSDNNSSSSGPGTSAYSTPRSSSEKLDVTEETLCYQEKLITECKTRMKDKFNSLEKETGVKLRRYWSENVNDSTSDHGSGDDDDSSDNESHQVKKRERSSSTIAESSTSNVTIKESPQIITTTNSQAINNHDDNLHPVVDLKSNETSATNETIQLLHKQLEKVQDELRAKDNEIAKLARIRSQVEYELEDLTASLFEEANKMVRSANVMRAKSDRDYKEAMMKMHVLQAEVDALKVLVITSTPATPNKHLHPHIDGAKPTNNILKGIITKSHSNQSTPRKSPSNYELGGSPGLNYESNGTTNDVEIEMLGLSPIGEVDPVFHQQFAEWRKNPSIDKSSSFISSIYEQEINPVFNFKNRSLTDSVLAAIEDNSIAIESVSDKSAFPKKCALLDMPRTCKYRMKLGNDWYNISLLCRNRITAVCDLFCYLRYIQQGLVKSSFHDVYWEIMQRRKNIALSRLGLPTC
ncbi:guanine nucleotide exchange factor for Rab-3A-like isoform X2 [Panonychus citri]|uniref:guanine nucleotide exchange factor for Rab-3A-like isoform X2 n=1 Tax=Panonychus citri TaxID=50023 RepID=UPI0023071500|nr:guanine nucleotide exchange factor for Rab-3A-like isoform X2 [Panonychus citri]